MAFIRNTDKLVEGVSNLFFTNLRAQQALSSTVSGLESADSALDLRLDVIEGSGEGSVAKAEQDAKDYADLKISQLVNSAPEVLDTLKELADALGGDASFASTVAGQIGALDGRIDSLEADPTTKSYVDGIQSALDGRLDIIEGADSVEGSVAKAEKDAKDYADSLNSAMDLRVDVLESDPTTKSYVDGIQSALDGRLDIIEGADSVEGSVAKAEKDAKDYADSLNSAMDLRVDALEADPTTKSYVDGIQSALDGRLDIIEGADSVEGSVAKAEKDAKDYADSLNSAMDARVDVLEADPVTKSYVDAMTTSDIDEGSNLYYTQARFDSAFSGKSTSNLNEGSNLYYTQARFDSAFSGKSSTDLAEGSKLFFTDARAKSAAVVNSSSGSETDQAMSVSAGKSYSESQKVLAQKIVGDVEVFSSNGSIDADNVMCLADLSSGSITLTLPNVSGMSVGRKFFIKEQKGLANGSTTVTIQRQGSSEKIDGENSYVIKVPYESVSVMWDGSNWLIF